MTDYKQGRVFVTRDDRLIFKRKATQKWQKHSPISAIALLDVMPKTVITITHRKKGIDNDGFRRNW